MRKNIASQVICAQLNSKTDGSAVTSGTTTVYVTGDGGTQGSGSGSVVHEGQGCWSYVPTQAETNYNHVAFTFVNSSAVSQTVQVYPVSYDPTDATKLGLSTLNTLTSLASETKDANVLDRFKGVLSLIESQRVGHALQSRGRIFFVDPVNGASYASGARGGVSDPLASVQDCHDNLVTAGRHDVIILVAGQGSTVTTLTEAVTLSKRYTFVRGPGRDFKWTRSGAGDTITVSAEGIQLHGFQLETAAIGTGNGITATSGAKFLRVDSVWVNATQGHGISATDCDNMIVEHCHFQGTGVSGSGHGVVLTAGNGQTGQDMAVKDCIFHAVQGDAIRLNATGTGTITEATIVRNQIASSTGYGVNIMAAGVTNAIIVNNTFANNASGSINDLGTSTTAANNEQWATETQVDAIPTATENADALLTRDWTAVTGEASRSLLNAMRPNRNKWSISGTTLTVTKEDDTTTAWTAELTTNASAEPITGSDPG